MYSKILKAASVLSLTASALAHGGVTTIVVNGVSYAGWSPYNPATGQSTAGRPYASFNPILSATDSTMHCNDAGSAGSAQQTLVVPAGGKLTAIYSQWTHEQGPYTIYLASCGSGSCDGVNSASVKWFKIYELGLISGTVYNGTWANGQLMANLKWDVTIPQNLLPGNYLVRWETLALHQANTPQFYPECAQIQVTGSGTATPPSNFLVSIPGAWGANDAGVNIDIYSEAAKTVTTYLIPGPRVWSGFTGYAAPPNLPGSSSGGSTGTTTGTAGSGTTSTVPPASTGGSTSGAAHYAQCGGIGWAGATTCISPYTCTKSSDYYSQCL